MDECRFSQPTEAKLAGSLHAKYVASLDCMIGVVAGKVAVNDGQHPGGLQTAAELDTLDRAQQAAPPQKQSALTTRGRTGWWQTIQMFLGEVMRISDAGQHQSQ